MPDPRDARLIDSEAGFEALVASLAGETAIALDTESNSFHAYFERVCLIQISTERSDFVVDPLRIDVRPLGSLFASPEVEVVIHAADYDIRCLKRDYGFTFARLFDTMLAAKVLGCEHLGLAALVLAHFGTTMTKVHQRSDWGRRPLSMEQIAYASGDTRFLLPLRDLLEEALEKADRLPAAEALFRKQAACEPRPRRFDPDGYRKIRGLRALEPRGREVARALYLVREECAKSLNRPPFKIFGDEALVEAARTAPRTVEGLSRVKGLGLSTVRRCGDAIVRAIEEALEREARQPDRREG